MRQGSGARRGRGRGSNNNNNRKPNRNQSFDSNGPSVRIRGTASQLQEKYLSMARDASSAGDRVMAENYFQHADHYYRILAAQQTPQEQQQNQQSQQHQQYDRNDDSDDDNDTESQPFNGRDQRRSQNGQMRDTDPRARSGNTNEGQPPLDEGLHRMLGGDPSSSDDDDQENERPARGRRPHEGAGNGDAEPAPRRRRRKAAPDGDDDERSATETAD